MKRGGDSEMNDSTMSGRLLATLLVVSIGAATAPALAGGGDPQTLGTEPDLRVVSWSIDDTLDGNGDGGLHPGETAWLTLEVANFGTAAARHVVGQLSEVDDHPDVTILIKQDTWPDIPAKATGVNVLGFQIQIAPSRPCWGEVSLRLDLSADAGYLASREVTLRLADPQAVDMLAEAGRPVIYGAEADDEIGASLAAGDLDADGYDDLVIGVPDGDGPGNSRPDAGEVVVVYGGPGGMADLDLVALPSGTARIYGADPLDWLGFSVAVGDVDGDGFDDLLMGAPQADGDLNTRGGAGEVLIIHGSATRLSGEVDLLSTPPDQTIIGADGGDSLGSHLAVGDLDGDGFEDMLLDAQYGKGPSNGRNFAGEVAVIYGDPARPSLIDLASPGLSVAVVYGADDSDLAGFGLRAGDLDGDGRDDLILGSILGDGPGNLRTDAGDIAIIWGDAARLPLSTDLRNASTGVSFVYGRRGLSSYGSDLAVADLDADGFGDLIVGAEGADGLAGTENNKGEAAVIYGSSARFSALDLASPPDGVAFILGRDADDGYGRALAAADVDGDGFDDLAISGYRSSGPGTTRSQAGNVFLLPGGRRLDSLDLSSPPPDAEVTYGRQVDDFFGEKLASGDFDGDGLADLAAAARQADGPGDTRNKAGEISIIPGAPRMRYRWDPDTFAFIDATVGTDLGLVCDDCSVTIPIGFDFDFGGHARTDVTVSSNGYLTFGGAGDKLPSFCPPSTVEPNDLVAVLWDDWNPAAGGAVYALLEGAAPNRRLTIQWSGVAHFPAVGDATFEATLLESSDQILFQYSDVQVGAGLDNGQSAIVAVESGPGVSAAPASCYEARIADAGALRFRRYGSPTVVFRDEFESGTNGWGGTGLWHQITDPSCYPASRSPLTSWYYGQDGTCDYNTGAAHSGDLTSPLIPALPQDAELSFWTLRQVQPTNPLSADLSTVEASGSLGTVIRLPFFENTGKWRFSDDLLAADPINGTFAPLDLSSLQGQDVNLRFTFDTVDASVNNRIGWMLDNVTVKACPVWGGPGMRGAAVQARSTAQPDAICETASGSVDAVGSYCTACASSLTYQWKENGAPIGGATAISHVIPSGHPVGTFDYTVEIACPGEPACSAESAPASVTVVAAPGTVGPTLDVDRVNGGADLLFTWIDVAGADDYVLLSSAGPQGTFVTQEAVAPGGSTGATIPLPTGAMVYYRVAGRNGVCGTGPQN